MKKIKSILLIICLLIVMLTACGGDNKNLMNKEKWNDLSEYFEWYDAIYSKDDNIEIKNSSCEDNEIELTYTKGKDVGNYFVNIAKKSNDFVEDNPDYFKADTKINIEYWNAGTSWIYISNEPIENMDACEYVPQNPLDLSYILINGRYFEKMKEEVDIPVVEISDAQEIIKRDKDTQTYDISALDCLKEPQILSLSFYFVNSEDRYDYVKIEELVKEKFPDTQVIIK